MTASPDRVAYPNTTEGFAHLLRDMRVAGQQGNQEKFAAFIKDTEIPNCDAWLHKMYDSDKADSWMGLCEAKYRDPRERDLEELFERIAKQDGKFITRKVNDNPEPGKGLEWGWLQAIKQPLDIYWAKCGVPGLQMDDLGVKQMSPELSVKETYLLVLFAVKLPEYATYTEFWKDTPNVILMVRMYRHFRLVVPVYVGGCL